MRLLSVRPGATVLLLVVTLLIARASLSNLHTTAAAQGTVPTATATPDPTVLPTAPSDVHDAPDQLGGLFSQIEGDPPPSSDVETLASRLVGIDFGQLANAIESPVGPKDPVTGIPQTPHKLVLNLFADVVLMGIVEHVEPTASGHALWGGLEGVELGTMTLVVNGSVVVGTVRTPDAVYTIRTAAAGAYVVRQIDESSLPPLGEPLRGSLPEPDSPPPVRPQVRGPDAPDGTSTPTSTPTPVPTVPTSPSKPAPDEAMANGLFSEVEGDPPPSPGVDTLASRLVEIDFGQLSQVTKSPVGPKDPVTGKPTEPQALVLNLFDDVVLTGIVEHVEPTSSGHSLWGRLDGVGLGTFTLVVNGRVVIGTVRMPDAVYTIRTAGDGTYVIRQIDESSLPPLGEPLEPPLSPLSPRDAPAEADDVPSDDGSEIDVMVVYTPLAKHREGGRAAIEALIDLFVAETNQANTNSGVTHRIKLVFREEVDYTEDGDSSLDLRRLRIGSDGYMDDVHERRDMYGADLVHILVGRSDVCGRAHLNRGESPAEDEASGFGLTVDYCGGLVFAHELGHNMGLRHDRYELGVPRTGSHYGYVNQRVFEPIAPESALWHTIMAYPGQCWEVAEYYCEQIGYFSNPENNYNGDPMGVPADHPSTGVDGPANAVGTLNDRREITANFRQSSASPSPRVHLTLSPYWLSENGGVSTVTATLHRPSSTDTTVAVSASPSDAVTLSGSRTLTIPAGRTVSVDSVTITGVDNGDQTGDVIVSVSATATNPSSLGVIEPEPVELAIADDETTPVVTLSLSPSEIAEHEGWAFVTATLGNRSGTDTTVTVSAEPADAVEEISSDPLTIPAGQTENIGFGVWIQAVDNDELAEATQTVTVSGTSENAQGVVGPENVTLTIIDDEAPFLAADSIAYTFTAGIAGSRFLPEAEFGNGKLTYSLSPAPSNDVTFTPEPPARIGVSATSVAAGETSYTLTATDADGDTDTMTISITVRKGVCPNSAAVSGYSDPGIVHDCEALLASRDTLSVDQSLNWDEDLPINEWKGVELANGRVVGLRMSSEGIVGTIPSELGSLANLEWLSLNGNQLTGGIPEELGSLANLQSLSLWGNQLTGEIPPELGGLSNLTYLALANNGLTGEIPPELGGLSNLEWLDIPSNQLTGTIPKELGNLANLQGLYLWGNQLTGVIPKELGNLANLQVLYLRGNLLTGCVPDGLRDVPNNDFVKLGLPFCSEHPCVSGGAVVDATNEGLVSDCGMLLAARDTLAGTAALNWSADTPIADWTGVVLGGTHGHVTELDLGALGLNGRIPPELGGLSNLTRLFLHGNQLTGEIPPELGGLSNLTWLWLHRNQLTGEIPPELGGLSNLTGLWLYGNQLTGEIPTELGNLSNLQQLYLGGNLLTGCVPDGLRDVPNNDFVRLGLPFCSEHPCVSGGAVVDATNEGLVSDCGMLLAARDTLAGTASLNWSADTPIADWTGVALGEASGRVTEILLVGMGLNGRIPKELGSLANLTHLYLDNNQLTGEIPPELGGLSNLQGLRLWDNQLTGEIPPELGGLSNLTGLWLHVNGLTGEIPPELGGLSNLNHLILADNGLTGEIPPELGRLSNLTGLWLHDNGLTGEIPPELGGLSNLERLYLGGNLLTGCVPAGLRDVPNNDIASLGLPFCSEHPCVSGGAVVDATNTGLVSDCEALLAAQDTLAGTASLNWSADTPITEWNGVALGEASGRVTELYLGAMGLNGRIPPELGSLANLQGLYLSDNQLTGEIPPELGGLSNLTALVLRGNQLTGEIPPELGGLSNLTALVLYSNQLTGEIPPELGRLSNLTELSLWGNQLTGEIPPELGGLSNLTYLALSGNQLTGEIPPELGGLSNLEWLYLNDNQLTGEIPTELGNLSNLQWLYLGGNLLTGCVPAGLRDVPNNDIVSLGLPFCSEHPCVSGGAVVDATNTGLVSDCGMLLAARDTLAGTASLNWSADTPIADWTGVALGEASGRVTEILLVGMGLNGRIPKELGSLSNLTLLRLAGNQLTGEIPPELGGLSNLTLLRLASNQLTGEIPPELGGLSNLTRLFLYGNQLTGEIPPELGGLSNLTVLFLAGNQLTGEIPPELGGLSNLTGLVLSGNQLTGEIPPELGGLSNLNYLILADNGLTGEIPPELGGLSNLTGLILADNGLTGEIPPELGGLSNLMGLILADNQLTGEIPPELGNLSNLTRLFLSVNQLTGEIPPELGRLSNLQGLYLGGNRLTGCVPPRLGDVPDNDLDQLGLPFCPLSLPEAPTIGSVTSEMDSLTISWTPPLSDGGSDITAYDLRHIETDDDEAVGSNWTVAEDVWTSGGGALEYTLTGLTVGTEYDIQVRAVNAVGDGTWSATVTATLTTVSTCAAGVAVPDPTSNPGLVSDCESLLTLLDTLVEGTVLNWSADIPISEWDGIEEDSLEGTPPQVVRLYLGGLGLDGAVPSELSGLTELKELYLQDNDLSGPVPVELGDLSNLTHLHLQNNDLTGSIPAELGDLAVLRELRLDSNDLTGQLPPELGSLIRVTRLWVADNDLSGSIPAELGDMANLDWLNLGRNNFSGQIPAELGNLSRLRRLYIYENDLSGPIPGALGSLSRLTHIVAQANDLSGEIPEELGSLANLVWMGLHDNDLTGEIPAELGGLAKLQRLYLTNNELYGEVPEELGDLSALTDLWLNHNYLSGQIPHSLDNLDKLSRLRLAGNRFTGCLPAGLAAVRNSDADQLGLETCADPAVGTEYGVQEKTASGAVAPKQAATGDCATGGAVPDAANNPGLVSDCGALLAARDTLARTGSLNWSADTPITKWDGITVRGTPMFRNLAFAMRCVQCGHERDVPRPLDYPKLMSIPITVGRLKSGYPARTAGQRATETTG